MKTKHILLILTYAMTLLISNNTYAQSKRLDMLHLKDGGILVGKIIEKIPNMGVKIIDESGFERVFLYSDIEKQTKTKGVLFEEQGGLKNPRLAELYSFLMPGGGQYYTKHYTKGALMTAGWVIGWASTWASINNMRYERLEYSKSTFGSKVFFAGSVLILTSNLIYSIYDAGRSAKNHNEQIRRNQMQLKLQPTTFFDPYTNRSGINLGLTLQLQMH